MQERQSMIIQSSAQNILKSEEGECRSKKCEIIDPISNLVTPKEPQSKLCEHMEMSKAKETDRNSL